MSVNITATSRRSSGSPTLILDQAAARTRGDHTASPGRSPKSRSARSPSVDSPPAARGGRLWCRPGEQLAQTRTTGVLSRRSPAMTNAERRPPPEGGRHDQRRRVCDGDPALPGRGSGRRPDRASPTHWGDAVAQQGACGRPLATGRRTARTHRQRALSHFRRRRSRSASRRSRARSGRRRGAGSRRATRTSATSTRSTRAATSPPGRSLSSSRRSSGQRSGLCGTEGGRHEQDRNRNSRAVVWEADPLDRVEDCGWRGHPVVGAMGSPTSLRNAGSFRSGSRSVSCFETSRRLGRRSKASRR